MPKPHTLPTLFDDALQMNISKLKKWGYLVPNKTLEASLSWSRNGDQIGSISILVNTHTISPYIKLSYNYRNEPREYIVELVSIPSNLGKGVCWYFLCPQTNKRCRKLYSVSGYFFHRDAFNYCMYESQTRSKKWRDMDKYYGAYFKSDQLYEQLYKKHLKKNYAGKPTKKYTKLIQELRKSESISVQQIEKLMIDF